MQLILSSPLSLLLQAQTVNSLQRRRPTGDKTCAIRCDISLCTLSVPQAMPLHSGCRLSARPIGRSPPLHFAAFTEIRPPPPPRELSLKTTPQPLPSPPPTNQRGGRERLRRVGGCISIRAAALKVQKIEFLLALDPPS